MTFYTGKLATFLLLLSLCQYANAAADDPEAYMNATDMIRRWGFPVDILSVQTADGYILSLFRISHGRVSDLDASCVRPAVLMVHGFGASSPEFILNPPESSPAFILADAGFDVYLLNHRGSTYSKKHTTLNTWDNKFWQFSVDEMAKYDVPAVIDKVLEVSGQSALYWVGSSQGTMVGFMALADLPKYNSKVKALFQVGPVGTCSYAKGLVRIALMAYDIFKPLTDAYRHTLGSHEFAFGVPFLYRPLVKLCTAIPVIGPATRAPVYCSHTPSGTSTWNLLHLAELASKGKVEHMNHGHSENLKRYGQETPPIYNYSNIETPVYLIWGSTDWLADKDDIEHILLPNIREGVIKGSIEVPGYNHLDTVLAADCAEKVYNPLIQIMRKQESDEICQR